ncbi:metallophosphoesterase family protein [Clostridium sp.]|uniref:metallophosphoesterase family protein n=1 Tax=Clostridium sp. TaxID=1506 RepID=UPI00344A80B3
MKIGIISDTHNLLREEVVGYLYNCDLIIHAGDICSKEILLKLNNIAKQLL